LEAIERYSQQDDARIRDLQMNIERMQKELSKRKAELDLEVFFLYFIFFFFLFLVVVIE
jgi:uncharacterized membrane protein (DUF106 family)